MEPFSSKANIEKKLNIIAKKTNSNWRTKISRADRIEYICTNCKRWHIGAFLSKKNSNEWIKINKWSVEHDDNCKNKNTLYETHLGHKDKEDEINLQGRNYSADKFKENSRYEGLWILSMKG